MQETLHLSHADPVDEIMLKHPTFLTWRKGFASQETELHAKLDNDQLLFLFSGRMDKANRENIESMREEVMRDAPPARTEDLVAANELAHRAEQEYQEAVEAYRKWLDHESGSTHFRYLTQDERLMQFAARDHTLSRVRLENLHGLRSLEREALDNLPDGNEFRQWMVEMAQRANAPGSDPEAQRHQSLSFTQALSEFYSRDDDGLAKMRARHDQENTIFSRMSLERQLTALRAQHDAFKQQLHDNRFELTIGDRTNERMVLAPSEGVMQLLRVNAETDAPSASDQTPSESLIRAAMSRGPIWSFLNGKTEQEVEQFRDWLSTQSRQRFRASDPKDFIKEFEARDNPQQLKLAQKRTDINVLEEKSLNSHYHDPKGFNQWLNSPSNAPHLQRLQALTLTEKIAEYEAAGTDRLVALRARHDAELEHREGLTDDERLDWMNEQAESLTKMQKMGVLQYEGSDAPHQIDAYREPRPPEGFTQPSSLQSDIQAGAAMLRDKMEGLAAKAEKIFGRFTEAVSRLPALRDTARPKQRI